MNNDNHPSVCLFSDPNFFALCVLETLVSKNCFVIIVTSDVPGWQKRTEHLSVPSRILITKQDDYKKSENFMYAIFCGGFIDKNSATSDFKKFIGNKNLKNTKTLAIFPFETFSLKTSSAISISTNAGIIYLGDLLGQRLDLESNLLYPSLVRNMMSKRLIMLGIGEIFYPIFVTDAAKTIVKWLLSFGPYGKETFLLGRQISSGDFWKQNLKTFPGLKVIYDTSIETRFIPKGYEIVSINSNLNTSFNETYNWIIKNMPTTNSGGMDSKFKHPKIKKKRFKILKPYIRILVCLIVFPILTILLSTVTLFVSYKQLLNENINNSQNLALLSKTIFVIGKEESNILKVIPIIGMYYRETAFISLVGENVSNLLFELGPLVNESNLAANSVLGFDSYNIKNYSSKVVKKLENTYREISNFQDTTELETDRGSLFAKEVLRIMDFDKIKNLLKQGSAIVYGLPGILGYENSKDYLVLFENNMELRPTGGFIGSYGVLSFGDGKLNSLNVNDVYSADGQLKGHVEPPLPIKQHLNEANWWFRDSNWDPDFPTSAERAEWFLNKEMNQSVDGVIAIDLEPIKRVLSYTGSVFLPDYNLSISSDNLYEKTQEEAQSNFFPGSRKKASFLTALSRSIIDQISKMNSKDKLMVLKAIYEGLTERHVQIYLHDQKIAEAINKMGWDGSIQTYSCGENCFSDFFGEVEANVGVNKANYFIKRKIAFNIDVLPEKITRRLVVTLNNSANPSLGLSGVYKTYMRIMVPPGVDVLGVKSIVGQSTNSLPTEITQNKNRQEIGVIVSVNPGETKDVLFEWVSALPLHTPTESYGLFIRKQAGVVSDPLTLVFDGKKQIKSSPTFSLTDEGTYTYNTTLGKDFFTRLSW
jgi:hypothetical protein